MRNVNYIFTNDFNAITTGTAHQGALVAALWDAGLRPAWDTAGKYRSGNMVAILGAKSVKVWSLRNLPGFRDGEARRFSSVASLAAALRAAL